MTESSNEFTEKQNETSDSKAMSLLEHIGELRQRIVKSAIAVILFFILAMFFSEQIILFIKQPLVEVLPKGANALHFTGPMDVFITNMKVAFLVAMILGCPVWIYQFWRFVEPALYEHERKWILPFIFASVTLFAVGVCFCYFFIFPLALDFLIGLGTNVATSVITITDYTSLLMILIFAFGLVFQTPLILIMLAIMDLIDVATLKEHRKVIVVIIFVISALLTPPDPLSQVGLALPMWVMFEISIILIGIIKKENKNKET